MGKKTSKKMSWSKFAEIIGFWLDHLEEERGVRTHRIFPTDITKLYYALKPYFKK